jgi:hypothetical protein
VDNVAEHLLTLTGKSAPPRGHVFTLHAELEGMALAPLFERLLAGWRAQGYALTSTKTLFARLDTSKLPIHEVIMAEVPGRSGTLAVQGPAV